MLVFAVSTGNHFKSRPVWFSGIECTDNKTSSAPNCLSTIWSNQFKMHLFIMLSHRESLKIISYWHSSLSKGLKYLILYHWTTVEWEYCTITLCAVWIYPFLMFTKRKICSYSGFSPKCDSCGSFTDSESFQSTTITLCVRTESNREIKKTTLTMSQFQDQAIRKQTQKQCRPNYQLYQ